MTNSEKFEEARNLKIKIQFLNKHIQKENLAIKTAQRNKIILETTLKEAVNKMAEINDWFDKNIEI